MKRGEKITLGILTAGLLAALTIGGTLAYMTDSETDTNTFTVGSLDITLEEKNWDEEDGKEVVPGDSFVKDPVVEAVENDSYVRLFVTLKDTATGKVITDSSRISLIRQTLRYDSTYNAQTAQPGTGIKSGSSYSLADLSAFPEINPAFTADSAHSSAGVYCYTLNSVLKEGQKAVLFTNAVVPTDWSQVQLDVLGGFTVEVTAQAIQAKNFSSAAEAFAALDAEIDGGTLNVDYKMTK